MSDWLYAVLCVIAVAIVVAGPYVCAWQEDRDAERDAELWARMPGATR